MKMKKSRSSMKAIVNWDILSSNIQEAIDELIKLKSEITSANKPTEIQFEIALRHAYHHMNTSWNARHESMEKWKNQDDESFMQWGRFPAGLDDIEKFGDD